MSAPWPGRRRQRGRGRIAPAVARRAVVQEGEDAGRVGGGEARVAGSEQRGDHARELELARPTQARAPLEEQLDGVALVGVELHLLRKAREFVGSRGGRK